MQEKVRVAAVNLNVAGRWLKEPGVSRSERMAKVAREAMAGLAAQAAAAGVELLVLPALSGMLVTPEGARGVRGWGEGQPVDVRGVVTEVWNGEAAAYLGGLARRHHLYVVTTGLVATGDEGNYHHEAAVFGPDGRVVGRQAQTHARRREVQGGLVPVTRLGPVETPLARLGLVLGTDAWYPEVSRILTLSGADVLLFPQAMTGPYPLWLQVAGAWQEVQQNQVFGVESGLAGGPFVGRAAVFGPCEITPGQSGQLAGVGPRYAEVEAFHPFAADGAGLREQAMVTASLDFGQLAAIRRRYPLLAMLNPQAYQRYFPGVYTEPAREVGTP